MTCVACEISIAPLFARALALDKKQQFKLTLTEVDTNLGKTFCVLRTEEFMTCALTMQTNAAKFRIYADDGTGVPDKYASDRAQAAASQTFVDFMMLIRARGYTVKDILFL